MKRNMIKFKLKELKQSKNEIMKNYSKFVRKSICPHFTIPNSLAVANAST